MDNSSLIAIAQYFGPIRTSVLYGNRKKFNTEAVNDYPPIRFERKFPIVGLYFLTLPVETLWNLSPVEKLFGMRMAGLCQFYWRTCFYFNGLGQRTPSLNISEGPQLTPLMMLSAICQLNLLSCLSLPAFCARYYCTEKCFVIYQCSVVVNFSLNLVNARILMSRKTKLCTGVPQVTCDSHTDFKVKRSKVKVGRRHIVAAAT